jgi:hypothetical protein
MFEPMKHPMTVMNSEMNNPMRRMPAPVIARPEPAATKQESSWERGLRQAKEVFVKIIGSEFEINNFIA